MNNPENVSLKNLRSCVENAPEGTYKEAKRIVGVLNDAMDAVQQAFREENLLADNCDLAFALEAAMYKYLKGSNPSLMLSLSICEGFGDSSTGPAKERVIAGAQRDRDFLAQRAAQATHEHNTNNAGNSSRPE